QGVDDATQADPRARVGTPAPLAARRQLDAPCPERPRGDVGELPQVPLVAIEGMAGDEEADRLALGTELLLRAPHPDRGKRGRRVEPGVGAEETNLRRGALLGAARAPPHHVLEAGEEPGTVALERIEGATLDQALPHPAVHLLPADAEAEVVQT